MAKLTIRVGASVDRSLSVAFQPLIDGAKKAQAAVDGSSKKAGRAISTEMKKGTDGAEAAFRELEREMSTGMKHATDAGTSAIKSFASETKSSFDAIKKNFADTARAAEDSMKKIEKGGSGPSRAGRAWSGAKAGGAWLGQGALDVTKIGLSQGYGLAQMVGHAAGVKDPSQLMADNASLETLAAQISNAGYMPGAKGANGKRQDPAKIIEQLRQTGIDTGTDSLESGGGLAAFVGKTGDLQTGRDLMGNVNRLSKASGSSSADMFGAAGEISDSLGDVPDKAAKIYEILKMVTAQGKEGTVEIKDLASQMAKLGAAAGSFSGDRGHVIAEMGALTQMSRTKGGSASATQAATSTLSFTNTFDKGAREKAFKAFGVKTRNESGMLMDPKAILLQAISQASSSQHGGMANFSTNMGQMFADTRARSATRGFETTFKEAGGGDEGLKAVSDAFDHLAQSTMSEAEVADSFAAAMKTSQSTATTFNEEWAKQIGVLQTSMLPALQAVGPAIVDATKLIAEAARYLNVLNAKQDDAGRAADFSAQDARVVLNRDQQSGGETTPEHMAAAEKALAELDAQIKEKGANMTASPSEFRRSAEWALTGQSGWSDAKQDHHLQDERQITSMNHERNDLADQIKNLRGHLAGKDDQIKVVIVGDTTQDKAPSKPSKGRGRSPDQDPKR